MKLFFVWIMTIAIVAGGYFTFMNNDKPKEEPSKPNTSTTATKPIPSNAILEVAQITEDMKGKKVILRGYVNNIEEGKGHVFAIFKDIKQKKYLKVVLFEKTVGKLPERKTLLENCQQKSIPVFVEGKVDIYKNELEVVAFKVYTK